MFLRRGNFSFYASLFQERESNAKQRGHEGRRLSKESAPIVMSAACLGVGPNCSLMYFEIDCITTQKPMCHGKSLCFVLSSLNKMSTDSIGEERLWTTMSSLPCSSPAAAATSKVRRPLIVAGEDLVGVHPPAHLAVPTPVVLSLVL